jgi:hypothetical protein
MRVFIDPPSGWQYGFPKVYDSLKDGDVHQWLIREGYPQKEIDSLGKSFYFRSWEADEQDGSFQQGIVTKKG